MLVRETNNPDCNSLSFSPSLCGVEARSRERWMNGLMDEMEGRREESGGGGKVWGKQIRKKGGIKTEGGIKIET